MTRDTMPTMLARAAFAIALMVSSGVLAQGTPSPTPGPTNPTPPNPQSKEGATIVINPTIEECKVGWQPGLRWTKEQFDRFCTTLQSSK